MPENEFGKKIKQLRKQQRITQKKLAENVGIDVTYLSKIENGKLAPPAQDKIKKMAKILEVNEDELITLADKVPEDLTEIIPKASKEIPSFLREAKDLNDREWEKLKSYVKEIKRNRSEEE